jgi:hypothetical protein
VPTNIKVLLEQIQEKADEILNEDYYYGSREDKCLLIKVLAEKAKEALG